MSTTPGPWQRKQIPGHLFEISNAAGEVVLRIRGGMMPTLNDARLLTAASEMRTAIEKYIKWIQDDRIRSRCNVTADHIIDDARALLARCDEADQS